MSWSDFISQEQSKEYYGRLKSRIEKDIGEGYIIYPPESLIFNAFNLTPIESVKVVILGQDPYINPGQAMGLSFSVPEGIRIPPSLRNIFSEIEESLGITCYNSGDLTRWAKQGVFLLNTTLTVREGDSNSHELYGWKNFTANALRLLNDDDSPKVFMLFGKNAQKQEFILDNPKHLVIKAAHPSPLSARRGFFGCNAFAKANQFLSENGFGPIDWR